MSVYARTQRVVLRIIVAIFGTAVVAMGVLVFVRLVAHSPQAEAASVIYYPNFCLGGWKYPQHASGPAAVTGDFDPDKFNGQNSAFLESSVASQLFCGYFSVKNAKNQPTKATISFNWLFAFPDTAPNKDDQESYTSTSTESAVIAPATGFAATTSVIVQPQPQSHVPSPNNSGQVQNTAAVGNTTANQNSSADATSSGGGSTTTEVPLIPDSSSTTQNKTSTESSASEGNSNQQNTTTGDVNSSNTNPTPVTDAQPSNSSSSSSSSAQPDPTNSNLAPTPEPTPTPTPTPAPDPAPTPAPTPAPSGDAPQSLNSSSFGRFITSLLAEKVHAEEVVVQSPLNAGSFKDFLEISYSLDGIRWTSIGRVNRENWKNYKVEVPVNSWDEVKRLQVMISVLPTIEDKPDIYLDSISMRAEYNRTTAELAADGMSAVSNAVDTLIGDGNGATNDFEIIPDAPRGPRSTEVRIRKLFFSAAGRTINVVHDMFDDEGRVVGKKESTQIKVESENKGASLIVTGKCDSKYAVILTYRAKDDYLKHRGSYVVNRAQECVNGSFSFDFATLSPETRDGAQYLVVGKQGENGTWEVVSDVVPIMIEGTTTVSMIYKQAE